MPKPRSAEGDGLLALIRLFWPDPVWYKKKVHVRGWFSPYMEESSQKLKPPHFDKEKPRAEQADPQSLWKWRQKEAHGPIVVLCVSRPSHAPCTESFGTIDGARSGHFAMLTRANMRDGCFGVLLRQVFSNQAGAKPISPSTLILSFSEQLSL